jgi:hypothetical protein
LLEDRRRLFLASNCGVMHHYPCNYERKDTYQHRRGDRQAHCTPWQEPT